MRKCGGFDDLGNGRKRRKKPFFRGLATRCFFFPVDCVMKKEGKSSLLAMKLGA